MLPVAVCLVTNCPRNEEGVNAAAPIRAIVRVRLHCSMTLAQRLKANHARRSPRLSQVHSGEIGNRDLFNIGKNL